MKEHKWNAQCSCCEAADPYPTLTSILKYGETVYNLQKQAFKIVGVTSEN